ncbi:hypothetical protein HanRHA438_Chr16g0770891 [Helianthus annuus]|nr:hypothetical protein HanRHA438_Chr16g0770891 [Helianthus annuus]
MSWLITCGLVLRPVVDLMVASEDAKGLYWYRVCARSLHQHGSIVVNSGYNDCDRALCSESM